jgi:hypothetical protein
VSHLRPYNYWSEARTLTTSNTQWTVPAPFVTAVPALRRNDDTYVRSKWAARVSYRSDGTGTNFGWWGAVAMRLVISSDPQALAAPFDVGDNDPLTLAFTDMQPRFWRIPGPTDGYLVDWVTEPTGVIHQTRRDYVDAGHPPQVTAALYWFDPANFLSKLAETAPIIRTQITGRVLWESSQATP